MRFLQVVVIFILYIIDIIEAKPPLPYPEPVKCIVNIDTVLEPGESLSIDDECMFVKCDETGSVTGLTCPLQYRCELEYDKSKHYPDCCIYKCDEYNTTDIVSDYEDKYDDNNQSSINV